MPKIPGVNRPIITDAQGRFEVPGLPQGAFEVSGDPQLVQTLNVKTDWIGSADSLDPVVETVARGFIMWFWVAVGLVVVGFFALWIDGDFNGPPRVSPLQTMNYYQPAPALAPVPVEAPSAALAPAPVPTMADVTVEPTPKGNTITMHGKTVPVERQYR